MRLDRRLAATVLAALLAAPAGAADCGRGPVAEIPLLPVANGLPVVAVAVNGAARRFLVEPGALWSSVSAAAAAELGLQPLPLRSLGHTGIDAGGDALSQFTVAERFQFGGMETRDTKLLLLPRRVIGPDLDGVLGSDLLGQFDLEFDFAKPVLRIVSPPHCPGQVVGWTRDYAAVEFSISPTRHLVVPMTLDGKRVSVAIDTARIQTALGEASAARLFGLTATSPDVDVPADAEAGKTLRFRHQFESLAVDGVVIRHPTVYVWADEYEPAFAGRHTDQSQTEPASGVEVDRQDLKIGMEVLRHLHLYIAFREKMLYLSAADAH